MERPIKKDPGTHYTKLDTPSLILDLDAAKTNLTLISTKLNSLKLKVRWNVNSHLTKDILSLQMKSVSDTKGISVTNISQASIFSSLSDDIIVNNVVLSESKLSSITELNASPVYSSILQLNKIKSIYSGGLYIKIRIDSDFKFESDVIKYLLNENYSIKGIIFEFYKYEKSKSNVVQKFLNNYPSTLNITDNFIASGDISIDDYEKLDSNFTEIIIDKLPLTDIDCIESNPQVKESVKVLTTVLSKPDSERIILDTGQKAVNIDYGFPKVKNIQSAQIGYLSAEHTNIELNNQDHSALNIGDKIELIPSDISSIMNQFNFLSVVKNDKLISTYEITARGAYK